MHTQLVFTLSGGAHVIIDNDTECNTANTHMTKEATAAIRLVNVDRI